MKATRFDQFLQNREQLKLVDRPHWIYLAEALIWSAIIITTGLIVNEFIGAIIIFPTLNNNVYADGLIVNVAAWFASFALWGSILIAVVYFLNTLIFWASTYIFASDRRLYMKTGLLRVLVNEVSFDEIRKTDINYGWFGRLIGYGRLMMDARFVEDTDLPYIYNPEQFSKLIHYSNDLDSDINLSYVTKGMSEDVDKIIPQKSETHEQVAPMHKQAEFADYAFDDIEKQKLDCDTKEEQAHQDFEDAVDVGHPDIEKPANTSAPPKVNV